MSTTASPSSSEAAPTQHRPLGATAWRSSGPALIAALVTLRTFAAGGFEPAIGLSIALLLAATAVVARRTERWVSLLLLVGPIALITSPARTELSFSLARPDDTDWFVFVLGTAIAVGLCIAAAVDVVVSVGAGHRNATLATTARVTATVLGAAGFAAALVVADPQPDLGRDLGADERNALVDIGLVNFAFAVPSGAVDDYVVTTDGVARFRARLVNDSDLPHTFTIEAFGLDVYVPAGRDAVVDVDARATTSAVRVVCLVGDHADLGMVATLR